MHHMIGCFLRELPSCVGSRCQLCAPGWALVGGANTREDSLAPALTCGENISFGNNIWLTLSGCSAADSGTPSIVCQNSLLSPYAYISRLGCMLSLLSRFLQEIVSVEGMATCLVSSAIILLPLSPPCWKSVTKIAERGTKERTPTRQVIFGLENFILITMHFRDVMTVGTKENSSKWLSGQSQTLLV